MHNPAPCKRRKGLYLRYSAKNWSDEFVCCACGKARRFSLNYLGLRRVPMCDGESIKAGEALEWEAWRALTDQANRKETA
jgi:hypothetical protein